MRDQMERSQVMEASSGGRLFSLEAARLIAQHILGDKRTGNGGSVAHTVNPKITVPPRSDAHGRFWLLGRGIVPY